MCHQILFPLLLLLCGNCIFQQYFATAHEYAAFADFLRWQHLKHAVIIATNNTALRDPALRALLSQFHVRIFNTATAQIPFTKSCCYYNSPRVGIYLAPLEDILLQQRVLQSVIADAADGNDIYNNTQAWFIVSAARGKDEALANARRIMTQLSLNVSADITLAVNGDNNSQLQLFDVYKLQPDRLEIIEKGYWHMEDGLKIKSDFRLSFVQRRRNLAQLVLRAGTVLTEQPAGIDSMAYLQNNVDSKNLDSMQRKTYQLMATLEPIYNISYQVSVSHSWGVRDANGSWSGVVSHLIAHDVELAVCPVHIKQDRIGFVTYTFEVHTEHISFLLRHPRRKVIRNIFIEPFVDAVWISIAILIIIATLLLAVHLRHEYQAHLQPPSSEQSFDYIVLSMLKAVVMQGPSSTAFSANSTRLHVLCVCLFSFLLLQFYSAFIVGSLLTQTPRTLTTVEALYNSSMEIGMEEIPYNYDIFSYITNRAARALYTERICKDRNRNILSIEQGAARIKKGDFAFHVSIDRIYWILLKLLSEAEYCDLQEITFDLPFVTVITLHKNSPFREHFAQAVLRFRTSGLLQYHDKQWQTPKLDCRLSQTKEVEVDLQHFIPALVLLAGAMFLSVIVLLVELVIDAVKRKWRLAKIPANSIAALHMMEENM